MFKWQKLGKVFDPRDFPGRYWLNEFAQAPSTLIMKDRIRVYFSCRPTPDITGNYVSYSAYVDLDRNDLTNIINIAEKPILVLGDIGDFDEFGTYPVSVIQHKGQLIAYYAGWTRCESVPFNTAIGMAVSSDDGETFAKLGKGPILSYTQNEPFIISGPKIRRFNDTFKLFYIAGRKWKIVDGQPEPVYKIRMASSCDGINWDRYNKDLISNKIEPDEAQASPDVFYYKDCYHMFFCYRYSAGFRSKEFGYRIGYAYSHDLENWTRDDDRCGIDISSEGWDSEMISYPHLFEVDGEIYMAYLGNQVGRFGFGLARLESGLSNK